jgi:hypothetical protein
MLHDPGHKTPPEALGDIKLDKYKIDILCKLSEKWAEIAALPVHRERSELWQKLNNLESERPMVWINEIPWHEMNYNNAQSLDLKLFIL